MISVGEWLRQQSDLDRLDRELLVCEATGMSRAQVLAHPEVLLSDAARSRLARWATRLREGEPLAYLLGRREFWGLDLAVCPAVLIPRPETELLVSLTLEILQPGDRVLELGTGSGAIAIAVASSAGDRNTEVTATDRSAAALAVAQRNAAAHGVNVRWVQSDWLAGMDGTWQVIVSNPPYVAEGDPHLTALGHEPRSALCGGLDGLADLRRIVADAPAHLSPGGWLLLEHGWDQGPAVRNLMAAAGLEEIQTLPDLAGHDRVTRGRRP